MFYDDSDEGRKSYHIFLLIKAAVDQEVERYSTNRKIVALIPGSSSPHVHVSLGKILNLSLLLMAEPTVYECV